ncbi:rhodanese-like domain-containing protein [Clostridium sp. AF29-8BH]|uniref:rhodanese-like domain-containing protein n=1 Tax=Clostridium sp. AF29-8BH TaxID=2293009 RepID=UPI0026995321
MKTITIEELEALKDAEKTIVDIRPQDQYMRGTFPGAVSSRRSGWKSSMRKKQPG